MVYEQVFDTCTSNCLNVQHIILHKLVDLPFLQVCVFLLLNHVQNSSIPIHLQFQNDYPSIMKTICPDPLKTVQYESLEAGNEQMKEDTD